MTPLAIVALVCGGVLALKGMWLIAAPRSAAAAARRFPRHAWAGRLLAAIGVAWSAVLLYRAGFAWVDDHRLLLVLAVPVAYALVIVFVDDLLAARAAGGLLLLIPLPILAAAFTHPARSRLVMTAFAYLLVAAGMALVWSPYLFRRWTERWIERAPVTRAVGAGLLALGLGMLALGAWVY